MTASTRKTEILTALSQCYARAKKENDNAWPFFPPVPVEWPFGANENLLADEIKESKLTDVNCYRKARGLEPLLHLQNEILAGKVLPIKIEGVIPESVGAVVNTVEVKQDNREEPLHDMAKRIRTSLVNKHKQRIDNVTHISLGSIVLDWIGFFNGNLGVSAPAKYPFELKDQDEKDLRSLISQLGLSWQDARNANFRDFMELFDGAVKKKFQGVTNGN